MLFYSELLIFVNYWQLWSSNYAIFPYLHFLSDVKSQQLLYIIWPSSVLYIFFIFTQVNEKNIWIGITEYSCKTKIFTNWM